MNARAIHDLGAWTLMVFATIAVMKLYVSGWMF